MPLSVRLVVGLIEVLVGFAVITMGVLGARSRLPRNGLVGVRTPATMRTPETFEVANRAAAVPLGAAGSVALLGGAALLAGIDGPVGWVVLAIGLLATVVLVGVGGMVGDRAAAAVPAQPTGPPGSNGCAGQCAGCELVAGCRPGLDPEVSTGGRTAQDTADLA